MLILDDLKAELMTYKPQLDELHDVLAVEAAKEKLAELQMMVEQPGFWDDVEKSQKTMQIVKGLEGKIEKFEKLTRMLDDTIALIELCIEENDDSSNDEIEAEAEEFKKLLEEEKLATLMTGEYDNSNAIITFHAGSGGTEAQDWAEMLYRMYNKWADKHGFKVELLDYLDGDEAGMKSASMLVEGTNAYGFLKSESGVHRLVRVSPFDAAGRRHTSFAAIEIMPEIDDSIEVDIRPEDIKMDVFRSSGAGGQHINKTSSAIRITHLPTGMVVECQDERSQYKNKDKALKVLKSRLLQQKQEAQDSAISAERKSQVGSGDRSERIRTYNYPQGRLTDHRIGLTLYRLEDILNGDLEEVIDALITADRAEKLKQSMGN